MFSKVSFALFFLIAAYAVNAQNAAINTGTSYYALKFPAEGQASVTLPEALSEDLPLSFSFEAWVMLPEESADGVYKTIVSRYAVRPDGTYHNRYADFNLQVQRSGTINFFMGSGISPDYYGVIISSGTFKADRWTHLAFTVHTESGEFNPSGATLFVDGEAASAEWKFGDRQLREDVPIHLGAYLNQDGDVKWWRGYMDEIRIWGIDRTEEQVMNYMMMSVPVTTQYLLAYYKCDAGSELVDETGNYDGEFVTGAGSVSYGLSGVKLGFEVGAGRNGRIDIELEGVGTQPYTYVIETLPEASVGRLLLDGDVLSSNELPYSLPSNMVTFEAANVEGESTTFTYYGTNSGGREEGSTIVTVVVDQEACNPDACGVCNGDNSTCTCLEVPYHGYSAEDLERILLVYEIEQSLDLLNQVEVQLDQAMDAVSAGSGSSFTDEIHQVQEFSEVCLDEFHQYMGSFLDDLSGMEA